MIPRHRNSDLPLEVYASLVDALFDVQQPLFIGSLAASLAALITAWKVDSGVLLAFGIAIAVVSCIRAVEMRAYARVRSTTLKSATAVRKWEHRYVIGAAAYVALLGGWTLAAFIVTDDPFVRLFSFSVTLAYMIGTSGRNFASDLLVISQIVGAGLPLSAALFVAGGLYYTVFGIVLLPFFASLKLISDRLRWTLLDAVIASRDISKLAARFDTALNNMPHGLCMFDAERRLVVFNGRLAELLGIPPDMPAGKTAREVLLQSIGSGEAPNLDVERFISEFEAHLSGVNGSLYVEIRDGRTLALTAQPMDNGGSVVIVEDITERRNAEARIHHLAHYDALTDLPNRTYFHDELDRILDTMRWNGPSAVLFVDLDQFKQVNDTLGHPRGDELLRAVAGRLRALMRRSDIVAQKLP